MKSFLLAILPWDKNGFNTKKFAIASLVLFTLYVMPGCIYKYTIGDRLEEERRLKAYQEKNLDVCTYIAFMAMRDYGEAWRVYIDDVDAIKPQHLKCSKVVPAIEKIPDLEEGYRAWKTLDDRGF